MIKLLFVLMLLLPNFSHAATLDLSNLSPEARARAEKIVPHGKDADFAPVDLDNLIRHLVSEQQYDSAEVIRREDNGKIVYTVRVGRIRRITTLNFHGYSALAEADLRREFALAETGQFDQQSLYEASERIRQFYVSQGYALAKVDLEFRTQKDTDGVAVDVRVTEGPQTTIREFEIVADNPELREKLKFALRGFRKDPINEKTMSELRGRIREFLSSNHYFRAEIQDPTIVKTDQPAKSKLIYRFVNSDEYALEFRGNVTTSDRTINKSLNLDQFTSSNPNVGAEIASKIKNFYISSGYARAEVQVDESTSSRNKHVRILQFNIKEGPQVKIKSIDWVGRFSESPKTYTRFVRDHSSDAVSDNLYVKDDIDTGLKNLIIDRRNQGFLKAKIVSTRASNNPQKNEITLQVNFDEGPLTQVRSIRFIGNQQLPEVDLRRQLDIEESEPLKLNRLEDSILKLKRYYQGQGFLEMAIVNEKQDLVRYNDDNTLVDVVFQIFEGPQVKVGSIHIDGLTITKEYVVYKELEFKVGEILTPEKIEESVRRLQRIGHFSSVEIKTAEENTPNAVRTVLVKLTDRNPGLFLLGVGLSNERTLTVRGYTGISYRNISGMGRGLSGRIDANYNVGDKDAEKRYPERKITVGYLEPYLFDTRMRGRVNLTQAYSIKPTDSTQGSELRQTTWTVEHDMTSHVLFSWDLFSLAKFRDFKVPNEDELTTLNIGSTAMTVDIDFRDHPFIPTRGTFTRLNIEYGHPFFGSNANIQYQRAFGSFTHYQSLGLFGMVWANSVRGGYLKNVSPLADGFIPYDKRGFILGGESTVRGFTPGEGFPTAADFIAAGVPFGDNIGPGGYDTFNKRFNLNADATMYLIKSEIRFPLPWWKNVAAAVFYDGGQVTMSGLNFDRPYRDSFGIAARYITPVGALSAEYGWKIKPRGDRGEASGVFNISVGTF